MQKKKRGNTNKSVKSIKVEYVAIALMIAALFAFFSWGFIGIFLANSVRIFVGNLYHVFSVIIFVYACYYVLKKSFKLPFTFKQLFALILFLVTGLIMFTLLGFPSETQLLSKTWDALISDILSNRVANNVGGGIIGAIFANIFIFLFGEIGTFVILMLLSLTVIFLLSGFTVQDVIALLNNRPKKIEKKKPTIANLKQGVQEIIKTSTKEPEREDNQSEKEDDLIINAFSPSPPVSNQENNKQNVRHTQEIKQDLEKQSEENDIQDEQEGVTFQSQQDNEHYVLPPVTLLNQIEASDQSDEYHLIKKNSKLLEETFKSFGVNARVISANLGPSVTKFEIQPAVGVKVSKIVSLADDIALALAARDIRIEAPIPGKSYVGIEVPNQNISMVSFREIIENNIHSKSKLEVPLGRDISGNIKVADLSKMPHLLVAGATGSGKSVAINGMITSILMKAKPNEVKLMMIDPKKVELNVYNGIPHLLTPVVTNPRRAAQALQKVVAEMERRYELFAQTGMRNITGYNDQVDELGDDTLQKMPYIVVIVDELADLMMVASNEVEAAIIRLAQMARAAGIHMVLATQRPSVDVITGLIKANVPSRMAFAVSSSIDSRTIIDSNGAEKLLGRGDMLFMPMGENKPVRVQGAFLSDQEVEKVVEFVKAQQEANYVEEMIPTENDDTSSNDVEDELFGEIVEFLKTQDYISVSMLQRRFRIGFNRAARLMEDLEEKGFVGPAEGTKPRRVLVEDVN
ncbi:MULTISPECIES: DNA translocase FtsK [unclassified Granulicatella]|uniref:FtsK/SpoIIIE family DNA translocase n=1 Tax=unclassified Granulicatella TaxID=2630493 RepID=UPI00188455D7|nr:MULTISPECIES: DNA translocase FtsK [unclassified Granulicatella]MBF0780010.1 DNA translocase FtsK [Granulicatella sp. 19428wC4_WM01]